MQDISSLMQSIGPLFQAVGVVSNILTGVRNASAQSSAQNEQKQLLALTNPATLQSRIQANEQPLSQGLTQGVGNEVQGYLAERGLSESPSIQAQVLAQALGPYQLQEQQMATEDVFRPFGISPPNQIAPGVNASGLFAGPQYGMNSPYGLNVNNQNPDFQPNAPWVDTDASQNYGYPSSNPTPPWVNTGGAFPQLPPPTNPALNSGGDDSSFMFN